MLDRIRDAIREYGYFVYLVGGGPSPRFAYTIGLSEAPSIGAELVLAGGAFYSFDEALAIVKLTAEHLLGRGDDLKYKAMEREVGKLARRDVDASWVKRLLLGAVQRYRRVVVAQQLVPTGDAWTIDVPRMDRAWDPAGEPVWKYLELRERKWEHPVPVISMAYTDLDALRGAPIVHATRWEDDHWELYSHDPDEEPEEHFRCVPLATMLGVDPSLLAIVELKVGEGIGREDVNDDWQPLE